MQWEEQVGEEGGLHSIALWGSARTCTWSVWVLEFESFPLFTRVSLTLSAVRLVKWRARHGAVVRAPGIPPGAL